MTGPAGLRRAHACHQLLRSPWHNHPPSPFPDALRDPESRTLLEVSSSILLGESSSVPRDLHASATHPTLASDCAQTRLVPCGVRRPPLSCRPWAQQKGLAPLRAGHPPKGTHEVGGSTQSWAHSELDSRLPEQISCASVGTARALSPPLSSCRHACCCPEASPPPQAMSQKGFSVDASTRRWQKQGPDLRVSPAHLPLTPVTPQRSGICLDRAMMMKQGSSRLSHLSREL